MSTRSKPSLPNARNRYLKELRKILVSQAPAQPVNRLLEIHPSIPRNRPRPSSLADTAPKRKSALSCAASTNTTPPQTIPWAGKGGGHPDPPRSRPDGWRPNRRRRGCARQSPAVADHTLISRSRYGLFSIIDLMRHSQSAYINHLHRLLLRTTPLEGRTTQDIDCCTAIAAYDRTPCRHSRLPASSRRSGSFTQIDLETSPQRPCAFPRF